MKTIRWKTLGVLSVLGGLLAGCCVAPVGPPHARYGYGYGYGGSRVVVREQVPVVVVPPPPPRYGWRR